MSLAPLMICLAGAATIGQPPKTLYKKGAVEVRREVRPEADEKLPFNTLLLHGINCGYNYLPFVKSQQAGRPNRDYGRLATTYYYRLGPIGELMKRWDWFGESETNEHAADGRIVAALVGQAPAALGVAAFPTGIWATLWSEPPIAVLGMGPGTMAAYARPLQPYLFVERHPECLECSQPAPGGKRHFHFLQGALERGAAVKTLVGEPRATFQKQDHQSYYRGIVVELFKGPNFQVHKELLTQETLTEFMKRLTPDGVVAYHSTNRLYKLEPIIADACGKLGLVSVHVEAQPLDPFLHPDHFGSDWVFVARKTEFLPQLPKPNVLELKFTMLKPTGKHLWTDAGPKSFTGLVVEDPDISRLRDGIFDLLYKVDDKTFRDGRLVGWFGPVRRLLDGWAEQTARTKKYDE